MEKKRRGTWKNVWMRLIWGNTNSDKSDGSRSPFSKNKRKSSHKEAGLLGKQLTSQCSPQSHGSGGLQKEGEPRVKCSKCKVRIGGAPWGWSGVQDPHNGSRGQGREAMMGRSQEGQGQGSWLRRAGGRESSHSQTQMSKETYHFLFIQDERDLSTFIGWEVTASREGRG